MRRICSLAAQGLGAGLIVKELIAAKAPPMGTSGLWSRAYVNLVLADRRALAEFQPRYANGKPAGDPIPGYYPPAVTEAEWLAARAAVGARNRPRGRVGERVNLFSGLLFNAREGDACYCTTRTNNRQHRRVLLAARARENGASAISFPCDAFETAILSKLREVDPRAVLGDAPGQEEITVLSSELAHVQARQDDVAAELLRGQASALAKAARELDRREKELREQLAEAKLRAAHPTGEAWGEAMTLASVLHSALKPREARLKLRSLLRRLIKEIWILVVPRGRDRLAAVQVYFLGDGCRESVILHRPDKAGRCGWRVAGGLWAHFLSGWLRLSRRRLLGGLDLRKREDAAEMERQLLAIDPDRLAHPEKPAR